VSKEANGKYIVVRATFADTELEAVYEELHPSADHDRLIPVPGDRDGNPRGFFEMSENFVASLYCPDSGDIAADVSYLAIETSIVPSAAAPNWAQVSNTQDEDIMIAGISAYAGKAKVIDADIAALGPCRLAFYDAVDAQVSPADGGPSVWYIVMKGVD